MRIAYKFLIEKDPSVKGAAAIKHATTWAASYPNDGHGTMAAYCRHFTGLPKHEAGGPGIKALHNCEGCPWAYPAKCGARPPHENRNVGGFQTNHMVHWPQTGLKIIAYLMEGFLKRGIELEGVGDLQFGTDTVAGIKGQVSIVRDRNGDVMLI